MIYRHVSRNRVHPMWLTVVIMAALIAIIIGGLRYLFVFPIQPSTSLIASLSTTEQALAGRLQAHVRGVASVPHNLDYPDALEASARYIEDALRELGLTPAAQVFKVGRHDVRNIEIILEPTKQTATSQAGTWVIGAHYDAPDDSPGANDNGTGVAALIELVALLRHAALSNRVRLVFFVNEELPYGKTPDMGSYQHAQRMRETGEPILGMFALETLGYFTNEPRSQNFPFPLGLLFPHTGNFVAFVGMIPARNLVHNSVRAFRAVTRFPAIGGVAPASIEGIDLSDHWAYNHFGFDACMITDTAPFRNPYYHQPNDTPDTVDYDNLARLTVAIAAMMERLAGTRTL